MYTIIARVIFSEELQEAFGELNKIYTYVFNIDTLA